MIDEIVEDDVRVLRAGLREEAPERADVEAAVSIREQRRASTGRPRVSSRVEAAGVRKATVDLEAAPVESWTPETEARADRARLTEFLIGGARRTRRPGLPVRDQLREGDVYWVIEPGAERSVAALAAGRDLATDETAALLDALDETSVEVWDVTAAARQVMKRLYGDAAFARVEQRSEPESKDDGQVRKR